MFNPNDPYNQGLQNDPYNQSPQNNPYNPYNQSNAYPYGQFPQSGSPNWNGAGNQYRRKRGLGGCLATLVLIAILAGLVGAVIFVFQALQNQPPDFFFQANPFSIQTLLILGVAAFGVLAFFGILAKIFRGSFLGKLMGGLVALLICVFIGGFAFWGTFINPNVGMTRSSFNRTSVSISTGDRINFKNPADGVTQILCVGVDQQCQPGNGNPAQFDHGLVIQPGQIVHVTFEEVGDYQITSKTTPHMNVKIHVTIPDDSGD